MVLENILARDMRGYGDIAPNFALLHQVVYGNTLLTASVVGAILTSGLIYTVAAIVEPASKVSSRSQPHTHSGDFHKDGSDLKPDNRQKPQQVPTPKPRV
jgi:hypothetical protein